MKKILLPIILIFLLVFSSVSVSAQTFPSSPSVTVEYNLPYPGVLPDHPLYFLKKARDKIILFFTRDQVKKSQVYLLLADKNLVMGQLLWEKGKHDLSINTFKTSENYLLSAVTELMRLEKSQSLPPGTMGKLGTASRKHEEIISKILTSDIDREKQKGLNDALGITHQTKQQIDSLK